MFLLLISLGYSFDCLARFSYSPISHCDQTLEKTYYTICYAKEHRQARWVYYPLLLESIQGKQPRTNDFRSDPKLRFSPVSENDLSPTKYDRGHLVPAADMKLNYKSMSETFLMTNVSPQVASFNRGIWAQLEGQIRLLVEKYGDGFVVTGPVLTSGVTKIIKNITLPSFFYKILYIPSKQKMYAFLMPNQSLKGQSIWKFQVSVDQIEQMTEIDFFADLDQPLQDKLEATRPL